MFRKLSVVIVSMVALTMLLSACGSSNTDSSNKAATVTKTSNKVSLIGKWETEKTGMAATIGNGTIEIFFVSDDTKSLYWKGTVPTTVESNSKFISLGDTEAMDSSLLGSQDDKKSFKYSDGVISFDVTMLGTTKTIQLKKA